MPKPDPSRAASLVMDPLETDQSNLIAQVRDFYDKHPYPPPMEELDGYRQLWEDKNRQRADYHIFWPARPYREDLDILVAGCGTSQAAKYALRYPYAHIVGIDISSTSIHHTQSLKRKYNLTNLDTYQLSIERIGELDIDYDKIVCTGVLHHLPDPDAGLRALREVLKPSGAMHLMVYAAYGRVGIYMLQEYCRRLGVGTSEAEITDLANTLLTLPQAHPLARLLGEAPDFRRKAALADALLNPLDHAYTVPQFFDFIQGAGCTFGRWSRQAPYLPHCGDLADTPHSIRLTQLPVEEQYAAVELFRGTMLRHSAIIYRDDNPDLRPIQFDHDEWLSYIPHRLPRTISVEERLPPHAAAVLINQSHTYPDIYLPINHIEKHVVEAIDGQRSLADLIPKGTPKQQVLWRNFFEKLWCYDQITFQTSGR